MATKTESGQAMTSLLSRFGVNYDNAPAPTPAMLAFMRGLGMTLDTAADAKQRTIARANERTTTTLSDIDRGNERTKRNMLADLVRRGVLRSGEANTRYGEQAENVASQKSTALRGQAEAIDSADIQYNTTRDSLRYGALEKVLGDETNQATTKAMRAAQQADWERQDASTEKMYQRTRKAEDRLLENQIKLFGGR